MISTESVTESIASFCRRHVLPHAQRPATISAILNLLGPFTRLLDKHGSLKPACQRTHPGSQNLPRSLQTRKYRRRFLGVKLHGSGKTCFAGPRALGLDAEYNTLTSKGHPEAGILQFGN